MPDVRGVHFFKCRFDYLAFTDAKFDELNIEMPLTIRGASNKRKSEFLAGRFCASTAIKHLLGIHCSVGIGENRQPIFPDGIIGTISHTDEVAMCAVASSNIYSNLGIDIEHWFTHKVANDVKSIVVNREEQSLLLDTDYDFLKLITIAFSVKESLFKAIYKEVGRYFGFEAARIVDIDPKRQKVVLMLTETLSPTMTAERYFECCFRTSEQHVFTMVIQ